MRPGPQGDAELDPSTFFNMLRDKSSVICSSEVFLRRAVSSLYLALFNYWARLCYNAGKRGGGPLKDRFSYDEFHESILKLGLGVNLVHLYNIRVIADHYARRSTRIEIWNKVVREILREKEVSIAIDCSAFERALEMAVQILKELSKNHEGACT